MRTLRVLAGVLICLCGIVSMRAEDAPAPLFPDKNLEKAVRAQVFEKRDNDKPLVQADIENLAVIKARGLGITNLAGIEKCISLAELDLSNNKIADVTPLKNLKQVQMLLLTDNQVEDIAPLGDMQNLQYVELSKNKVKNIAPLAQCTNMHSIYVSTNQVTDLKSVFGLQRLGVLYADHNKVTAIDGINGLRSLWSLSLNENEISDLKPLVGLTGLNSLYLEKNKIKDLMPLVEMARKDTDKRFAPFLRVYLKGNPLSGSSKSGNIKELEEIGMHIFR
jgi:internalin A